MDAQYFIDKFEAIPEEKWCVRYWINAEGQSCANGHCGVRRTIVDNSPWTHIPEEAKYLYRIFKNLEVTPIPSAMRYGDLSESGDEYCVKAALINNGDSVEYQQGTPKQRILAALRDIQALEETEGAIELSKQIIENGNRNNSDNEVQLQSRFSGSAVRTTDEGTQRKHKRSSLLHRVFSFL